MTAPERICAPISLPFSRTAIETHPSGVVEDGRRRRDRRARHQQSGHRLRACRVRALKRIVTGERGINRDRTPISFPEIGLVCPSIYSFPRLKSSEALVPPKPKEFDKAYSTLAWRTLFGT